MKPNINGFPHENPNTQFFEHDDAVTRGFLVSTGPLAQLLNGVDLNESFSPESGGFVTTLTITGLGFSPRKPRRFSGGG